jgi:thiosulfate/3-mercaptopyruvate sulfurtransferase
MIDEDDIVLQPIEVHYLRMNVPPVPNPNPIGCVTLEQLHRPIDAGYYLDLYQEVGLQFNWVDRLLVSREELEALINSEDAFIYLLFCDGQPCGFTELVRRIHFIEILYFGLFP